MEIILLWSFVLAWMAKRGAEDLVHAVKGTPNPRYEVKKAKAKASGQRPAQSPRYGGKEWFADLYTDALAAHTEKRRAAAKAKAQPVDDMIGIVRESKPVPVAEPHVVTCHTCLRSMVVGQPCATCAFYDEQDRITARKLAAEKARREAEGPEWLTPDPDETPWSSVVHDDQHPYCVQPCGPACTAPEEKSMQLDDDEDDRLTADDVVGALVGGLFSGVNRPECPRCFKLIVNDADGKPRCGCPHTNTPAAGARPTARIYLFPNIKKIEKEITMPNSEATGLTTAIAFADAAADAHQTFSTAGSEGYAGALAQMGFGEGITSLAAEAREASANATAKWSALSAAMTEFMAGREFYANNPDAPEKVALVNE